MGDAGPGPGLVGTIRRDGCVVVLEKGEIEVLGI